METFKKLPILVAYTWTGGFMETGDVVTLKKSGEKMVVIIRQENDGYSNDKPTRNKRANDKDEEFIETKWVDRNGMLNNHIFHVNQLITT